MQAEMGGSSGNMHDDARIQWDWSINAVMQAETSGGGGMGNNVHDHAASETQGSWPVDKATGVSNVLHGKQSRVHTKRGMLYDEQLQEEKKSHKQNKK